MPQRPPVHTCRVIEQKCVGLQPRRGKPHPHCSDLGRATGDGPVDVTDRDDSMPLKRLKLRLPALASTNVGRDRGRTTRRDGCPNCCNMASWNT